jgi:CTP synthase (UTP-ammonia lyase)
LDRGEHISKSITVNLQSCKKEQAHISPLVVYNGILDVVPICVVEYNCYKLYGRYGNARYVDERHRHRYEVSLTELQYLVAQLGHACMVLSSNVQ